MTGINMKLSAAIRRGARLVNRQGFHNYFHIGDESESCACAMGAAMLGALDLSAPNDEDTLHDFHLNGDRVFKSFWPGYWTEKRLRVDGLLDDLSDNFVSIHHAILYLNDEQCWSFDRIADWLEERGL